MQRRGSKTLSLAQWETLACLQLCSTFNHPLYFAPLNLDCDVAKIYYPVQSRDITEPGSIFHVSWLTSGPYVLSWKVSTAGDQHLKFSNWFCCIFQCVLQRFNLILKSLVKFPAPNPAVQITDVVNVPCFCKQKGLNFHSPHSFFSSVHASP